MSQVISIRVPKQFYEEACNAFQKEVDLGSSNNSVEQGFLVVFDESDHEIRCEGQFPDSVFAALVKVKDQFGGKLFYEGEEWAGDDDEVVGDARPMEKMWIIVSIVFFPITLIYLFVRAVVWVPFKIWKATR